MRDRLISLSLLLTSGIFLSTASTYAGTNLVTTTVQGSPANWTAAIWKTNNGSGVGIGTALAPVAGNTYTAVINGTNTIGNGLNNTRVRNPAVAGTTTFPGDSLTLNVNTELRAKTGTAGTTTTTLNFPGVGGNPGLILNGGLLDAGDDTAPTPFNFVGSIQVARQSYISEGANGGGGGISANRTLQFGGVLSGTGNIVIMNGGMVNPHLVTNTLNTFSGQWILQCGWLVGTTTNSLGTNNITVNPGYTGYLADMPNATSPNGPTRFEPRYELNSAGVLTLTNGGIMRLHQNCEFTAVNIENSTLAAGTHFYSELVSNFPSSFDSGGSGTLTVQPYGTPPALAPSIGTQPLPQSLFAGASGRFLVTATGQGVLSYQWQKNGTNLADGGNILGSATNSLSVSNVASIDAGNYTVVVSNQGGSVTSRVAVLTLVAPNGEAYEAAVIAGAPVDFYEFNETGDPSTNAVAFDFAGGSLGVYGVSSQNGFNGTTGPGTGDGFPGFSAGNFAAQFNLSTSNSHVTIASGWNINTNAVTITGWINPNGPQNPNEGLVICRGGSTVAGINYAGGLDANGSATLGYVWDNEPETFNWNSGIEVPGGQWSFVALVVTPSNANLYMMNTSGIVAATHIFPHVLQNFNQPILIGDDSSSATGARTFGGKIDDVAVFKSALSASQLKTLFYAASGVSAYAPVIAAQPTNLTVFAGQTAAFNVTAGGSEPLTFQWQSDTAGNGVYANISNGGRFSGADTRNLVIQNVGSGDANNYLVIVSNTVNVVTSSAASLTVNPINAPVHITSQAFQPSGSSWDTISFALNGVTVNTWSDGNAATVSSAAAPGSTYELLPGAGGTPAQGSALLRSPTGPRVATFPGAELKVSGNGVWVNGPTTNTTTIAEIRFKQATYGPINGTVIFPKLIMNGGQLDNGADSGGGINEVILGGELDILTNAPIYNDNGADRGYEIDSYLAGAGTIEYHAYNQTVFQPAYTNTLDIVGTSNTFSGKWNIIIGTLLGSGSNSLGTNDIIISTNSAFETLYDVNNPNGNLFLSGQMYLHQNDTFKSLFVKGVPLAVGTYTFAQLNTAYPSNFPAIWSPHYGAAAITNGSGSITVLVQPAPQITTQPTPAAISAYPTQPIQITVAAQGNLPLFYFWRQNGAALSDNANIIGSGSNVFSIVSAAVTNGGNYDVVVSNSVGSVTSQVSVVTILPTGPVTNLTLDFGGTAIQQAQNLDWNTTNNWSDGQSATLSSLSNPGSTYEVTLGGRLRSPAGSTNSVFPGVKLTIDGSGILVNNNDTTTGEFRFKHADGGIVSFKKLVLNGGQLDTGDNGLIIIQGEIDVITNSTIYADNAAGVDRPYQIDALLTGTGTIQYFAYTNTFTGPLIITGSANTFSGQWNITQGALFGSGLNSLGTNSITISTNAALETAYDLHDNAADLILNGVMYLHQADTFHTLTVSGANVAPGTYTAAQLTAAYPTNFPATWTPLLNSVVGAASGSITVLSQNTGPSVSVHVQVNADGSLQLTWPQGSLQDATNAAGPWNPNAATSPFTVTPTDPQHFYRIKVQ